MSLSQQRQNLSVIFIVAAALTASCQSKAQTAQQQNQQRNGVSQNPTQIQQPQKTIQIDKNGLLLLIRQVLIALDFSNKSGNYGFLREISSPGFAAVNDSARLSRTFKNLRDQNVDLSGVLIYEPQLTVAPEITKEGDLHFAGVFPSVSNQIRFDMIFTPVNGQWKIFGLGATVVPVGLVAPTAAPTTSQPNPAGGKK
jgi:hypothetical protein